MLTASKPKGNPRRRRRQTGEHELWRVHGRDHDTGRDLAVGYLITSAQSLPIAYVHRLGLASLRLAAGIRRGRAIKKPAEDLRKRFPDLLSGYLLIPVRDDGHTISGGTFPAAMFVLEKMDCGESLMMKRFTAAGFAALKEKKAARRKPLNAAQLGGNSSNEGEKSTAA